MLSDIQQVRDLAARVRRIADTRNYNKLMNRAYNMAKVIWPHAHMQIRL